MTLLWTDYTLYITTSSQALVILLTIEKRRALWKVWNLSSRVAPEGSGRWKSS